MVSFGRAPSVPAHAARGNPLAPKRDRDVEAGPRGPAPPVPRAPRAAPKAQSAGALSREWSRRASSESRACLPMAREDDSLSAATAAAAQSGIHRRVSALSREVNAPEHQQFEMGPAKRPPSAPRRDFSRGHVLGAEGVANKGIPWAPSPAPGATADGDDPEARQVGRRHILKHERYAADQALEWVPSQANLIRAALGKDADHSRISAFKKEDGEAFDFLHGAIRNAPEVLGDKFHGRRNVLTREQSSMQSLDMPRASGYQGAVPSYARDGRLARENPLGGVFRGAGASVLAC